VARSRRHASRSSASPRTRPSSPSSSSAALTAAGIDSEAIVFDPGIGFGKTLEHNLALLRGLGALQFGDRPLLIGLSRKSFIGRLLDSPDPAARDWPTVALTAWTRESGARIHRVHDVRPNADALRMVEAIRTGGA
jgi:dihydropteroate synthase